MIEKTKAGIWAVAVGCVVLAVAPVAAKESKPPHLSVRIEVAKTELLPEITDFDDRLHRFIAEFPDSVYTPYLQATCVERHTQPRTPREKPKPDDPRIAKYRKNVAKKAPFLLNGEETKKQTTPNRMAQPGPPGEASWTKIRGFLRELRDAETPQARRAVAKAAGEYTKSLTAEELILAGRQCAREVDGDPDDPNYEGVVARGFFHQRFCKEDHNRVFSSC